MDHSLHLTLCLYATNEAQMNTGSKLVSSPQQQFAQESLAGTRTPGHTPAIHCNTRALHFLPLPVTWHTLYILITKACLSSHFALIPAFLQRASVDVHGIMMFAFWEVFLAAVRRLYWNKINLKARVPVRKIKGSFNTEPG